MPPGCLGDKVKATKPVQLSRPSCALTAPAAAGLDVLRAPTFLTSPVLLETRYLWRGEWNKARSRVPCIYILTHWAM